MQAMGRSAPREAMQHLEALLEALPSLPEGPERDQAELVAQMTLGPALVAIRGFASPSWKAAYTRAHQLCLALDRPYEETLVLHGLAAVNEFRGRYHRSEALLTQILHPGRLRAGGGSLRAAGLLDLPPGGGGQGGRVRRARPLHRR